jgi:hypothetical protein
MDARVSLELYELLLLKMGGTKAFDSFEERFAAKYPKTVE